MFTRPTDLTDSDIAEAITEGWVLDIQRVEHAAVGFGSHHWIASSEDLRWFVTVDDLETLRRDPTELPADVASRHEAALQLARALYDLGLDFVVAPLRTLSDSVIHPLKGSYVAALYPYVEGTGYSWGHFENRDQRVAVLDHIVTIHRASPHVAGVGTVDDLVIPKREALLDASSDEGRPWGPGPFAQDAKELLFSNADPLHRFLKRFGELAADVLAKDRMVVTHGEPHRANTIDTAAGIVLVDWDTARIAPPERDLWMLIGEDATVSDEYTKRTGVAIDQNAVALYRLWWDLTEVSLYIEQFRAPHEENADTRTAWGGLQEHLDPERWEQIV